MMHETAFPTDDAEEPVVVRDTRVEEVLDRWKITYELIADYPLQRLKITDETQVRASDHRAPSTSVDEYAQHMKNGAQFPPIVVSSTADQIDGNTRVGAAERLGRSTFPAYVVKLPNRGLGRMLGAALNQLNGRRLTPEELVASAERYLTEGYGEEAIARELGCSVSHVRNVRRERDFKAAAERTGVEEVKVTKSLARTLAGITHDEPFKAAVELVAEANPTTKETSELVEAVTKARSDEDAVAIVAAKRAEWGPAGPPPRRQSSAAAANRALRVVRQLSDLINGEPLALIVEGDARAEHAAAWQDLEAKVAQVVALYAAPPVAASPAADAH